jgi:hypothetical protein
MSQSPDSKQHITLRIRRRPWYAWLGWMLWLGMLAILLEFANASRREYETQAAVIALLAFLFVLVGGLVLGQMHRIEAEEQDYDDR